MRTFETLRQYATMMGTKLRKNLEIVESTDLGYIVELSSAQFPRVFDDGEKVKVNLQDRTTVAMKQLFIMDAQVFYRDDTEKPITLKVGTDKAKDFEHTLKQVIEVMDLNRGTYVIYLEKEIPRTTQIYPI